MQRFDQVITGGPHAGKTVIQSAQLQGGNMVFDAANLDAASGPRILGLFNAGNMSLKWTGLIAEPSPDSGLPTGQSCVENQRPANEPSLAAMTSKAIDLLHEDDGRAAGVYVQRFDRLGAKTGCLQRDRVRPGGDRSDV